MIIIAQSSAKISLKVIKSSRSTSVSFQLLNSVVPIAKYQFANTKKV